MIVGLLAVLFAIGKVTNNQEVTLLPVTRLVLTIPNFFFISTITLLTFIYSGMLIQRERMANMEALSDINPSPSWVFITSKLMAIFKMQFLLLTILMTAGILVQVYNEFYHFELILYLFRLFVLDWSVLILWSIAAFFIHNVFQNLYISLFILLMGWIGIQAMPEAGITTHLLRFNAPPYLNYSDMNGFGHLLPAYFLVQSYWTSIGGLLLLITFTTWQRGISQTFLSRLKQVSYKKNWLTYTVVAPFSFDKHTHWHEHLSW